jgi:hypothetical protein
MRHFPSVEAVCQRWQTEEGDYRSLGLTPLKIGVSLKLAHQCLESLIEVVEGIRHAGLPNDLRELYVNGSTVCHYPSVP